MTILCTFPGRHGDILWALPTVRAVSEAIHEPVDLQIAGEFAGLAPLLAQQSYLNKVWAAPEWSLSQPECVPAIDGYDHVFHLAYQGWPLQSLPLVVEDQLRILWPDKLGPVPRIDLHRPWINYKTEPDFLFNVVAGFTEAWFELKLGIAVALEQLLSNSRFTRFTYLTPPHSRWTKEAPPILNIYDCSWVGAARAIQNSDLFFGDCSALHVLACAMGKPVVLCEPMEGRWNDIFYPYGKIGRVRLVIGNDDKPTFDARACAEALRGR
jgi:hypothetical protein